MTTEQINIAIAESLGVEPTLVEWWAWKDDGDGGRICMSAPTKERVETWLAENPVYAKGYIAKPFYRYPNYAADLNACHEFEKKLSLKDRNVYTSWLYESSLNLGLATWESATATARQRCEACLRTIGRWKESA